MPPKIEHYEFGKIVIDGRTYTKDLFVTPGGVRTDWWREDGHSLTPADLEAIGDIEPATFIMGRGYHGVLTVPESTIKWFEDKGVEFIALPSKEAVARYNELRDRGDVVAGLHLTC